MTWQEEHDTLKEALGKPPRNTLRGTITSRISIMVLRTLPRVSLPRLGTSTVDIVVISDSQRALLRRSCCSAVLSAPLPRCEPSWTRHQVSQLKPGAIPAVFLSAASQHLVPVPLKAHRPPSALVQAERGWATARDPHLTTLVAARQVMVSDSPPSQSRQTANVRPAAAGRVADK